MCEGVRKFSASFKGFAILVLIFRCRLILLHFWPHLAHHYYHETASYSQITLDVTWYHPWVLVNAIKSHVNIFLFTHQKWWSMARGSHSARVQGRNHHPISAAEKGKACNARDVYVRREEGFSHRARGIIVEGILLSRNLCLWQKTTPNRECILTAAIE